MTADVFKFPHTAHLAWLASGRPRDDKLLSDSDRAAFLSGEILVEEKIDGANVGLFVGGYGRLHARNRGTVLGAGAHPQFGPLWPWMAARERALTAALGRDLMLFGEWCFAVHSVRYDSLPDWFLGFEVCDLRTRRFHGAGRIARPFGGTSAPVSVSTIVDGDLPPSITMRDRKSWGTASKTAVTLTSGVQLPRVSFSSLGTLPVALPPTAEQRRIVAAVEALLARVNAAKERLDRVPGVLKRFRQAVLAAACSGRLTEEWRQGRPAAGSGESEQAVADLPPVDLPTSWKWASVERLCRPDRALTYGVIKLGPPTPSGVPTLRSSDVRLLRIDSSDVKRIQPKIAEQYLRTRLEGGEVVVTVRGTLGGVAVIPSSMAGYNVSREVAVLPFGGDMNVHYLALAVASLPSQNWLMGRAKGVAYTGINIGDLRLLPLPVPPREEQDEIVRRVAILSGAVDAAGDRVVGVQQRVAAIQHAVLGKAFRGELVPTEAELARQEGREFESAEDLLRRVTATTEDEDAADAGPATVRRNSRRKR